MSSAPFAPKTFQIAAAVIGNALEWYDFIVFGFFAVIIALFFPAESQYASLLLTTATFGVGFLMRPVGGILLGIYADRRGRKASLLLIIGLMTLAIAMIGLAPTYAAIGIAAPVLIVLARLLQGFSAGGEALARSGSGRAYWCAVGRIYHTHSRGRGGRQLGLARAVFVRPRHRTARSLYPAPLR